MDLYNEKEHIISSDEYTDDDDLMNDAIKAQDHIQVSSNEFIERDKLPKFRIDQKQKELSSLIRRNKISVIYKNKSVKWLNNKKQRERYKKHIYGNIKERSISGNLCSSTLPDQALKIKQNGENFHNINIKNDATDVQNVVSIDDDDEDDIVINNHSTTAEKTLLQNVSQLDEKILCSNITNYNEDTIRTKNKDKEIREESCNKQIEKSLHLEKIKKMHDKRTRSLSPSISNESNEAEAKHSEKKIRTESPQFYNKVNKMFATYDKIATNHIDTITSCTLTATEGKMKSLLNEIQTLNEILHTKEMEWNRLLHLKMVKEEIYSRLSQKIHNLQIKENYTKTRNDNTLLELKEMEFYLSEEKPVYSETNLSSITIQKLIENRANMNSEDLRREQNNTSRLHSLLVSQNMLHSIDSSNNISFSNGQKSLTCKVPESCHHFDSKMLLSDRSHQREFNDDKRITADFEQKKSELSPRVGKLVKLSESNSHHRNFSIPIIEKTFPRPQYLNFTKDHQSECFPLRNSVEEISITPIRGSKKLPCSHETDFANTLNNHYNIRLEDNYLKSNVKRNCNEKYSKNMPYPLCQECKIDESRFVCAGCGNQWYCSKKCQITAWDKHSEICTE